MKTTLTNQRLAELVGGKLIQGDPDGVLTGLNSIAEAGNHEVTFLGNRRYLPALLKSRAGAALIPADFSEEMPTMALIKVENPTLAFSTVVKYFLPVEQVFDFGVHPSAVIATTAKLDPTKVHIGANVVIEEEVEIGNGTVVHAGVFIGRGTRLGENCMLHANCSVREFTLLGNRVILHSGSAVGTDGFGYEFADGCHQKIDQVGIVQIDDDVEIGSCTTIDRARFGRTWIGEGTKIDNLVQIAHNVVIGKHCIIVSQAGISGSTKIGNGVVIAGQVGIAGHLEIADGVTLMAKSGVTKSLLEPGVYTGFPARPLMEGRRMLSAPAKVPEMLERIRLLEKKLAELETRTCPTS